VHLGTDKAPVEHGKEGLRLETTIGQEWSLRWSAVIKNEIEKRQLGGTGSDLFIYHEFNNFWYCPNTDVWHTVLAGTNYAQKYKDWSIKKVTEKKHTGSIPHALMSRLEFLSPEGTFIQNDKIPLPQTRLSARSDPAVSQLQSRIAALESKLGQAKQDENTQFLLAKVLDKLDAIEEV
jgi:hypothetical protein